MFFRCPQPPALRPERVRQARFSLNRPVLATGELPAGPARAAILVHADEAGRCALAIGVRSLEAGEAATFAFEGELRSRGELDTALDAALSFGESMGFLFDDDSASTGGLEGRRAALRSWQELVGEGEPEGEPEGAREPAGSGPAEESEEELLLEDPVESESQPSLPGLVDASRGGEPVPPEQLAPREDPAPPEQLARPEEPAPQEEPPPEELPRPLEDAPEQAPVAVSNALPLTKFRGRASATAAPAPPSGGSRAGHALGRIPLRKRRRQETVSERPGLLVRILGAF